jgi:hypothetical protein
VVKKGLIRGAVCRRGATLAPMPLFLTSGRMQYAPTKT